MAAAHICGAIRSNGEPCAKPVRNGADTCWAHDPANAEQRKQNASIAAKAKASKTFEVVQVKDTLLKLADDLRTGRIERADASVLSQIYGTVLRAFEQERRVRETEELAERLDRIEEMQARRNNMRPV